MIMRNDVDVFAWRLQAVLKMEMEFQTYFVEEFLFSVFEMTFDRRSLQFDIWSRLLVATGTHIMSNVSERGNQSTRPLVRPIRQPQEPLRCCQLRQRQQLTPPSLQQLWRKRHPPCTHPIFWNPWSFALPRGGASDGERGLSPLVNPIAQCSW